MDRFSDLLAQLEAEHKHLLQEREQLRCDAEAWRAHRRCECATDQQADSQVHPETPVSHPSAEDFNVGAQQVHGRSAQASFEEEPEFSGGSKQTLQSETTRTPSKGSAGVAKCKTVRSATATLLKRWVSDPNDSQDPDFMLVTAGTCLGSTSLSGSATLADGWSTSCLFKVPVVRPCCKARVAWDVLRVVLLGYDVIQVPMLAFAGSVGRPDEESPVKVFHRVTTMFWTLDILASFLTGFYNCGVLEMRFREIAQHYLKGWFTFDLIVVILDWVVSVLNRVEVHDAVGIGRVAKMLRITRVLQLFRLLRMLKFPEWAERLGQCIRSEAFATYLGIMRSLLIIIIASHIIACAWYLIGDDPDEHFTWVQVLDQEERAFAYRYSTALHWSVTQFTPASMEVVPRNALERVFAVLVILVAMVAFSCFVSSITQAMASLQRAQMDWDTQQSNLRRYITENQIPLELGHRITKFMHAHRVVDNQCICEADVQIFKLLPPSLLQELRCEVYMPIVRSHLMLEATLKLDSAYLQEVCHMAMSEFNLGRGDELFQPGKQASSAYFMQSGNWEYHRRRAASRRSKCAENHDVQEFLGEKCVCEVALWCDWMFQGSVAAATTCHGVSLSSKIFGDLAERKPHILVTLKDYAARYLKWMESQGETYAVELGPDAVDMKEVVQETLELMNSILAF